jgi:hypothetical protein
MPKLNTSMLNTAVVDYSNSVETPVAVSTVESSVATIDPNDADTQEFLAESSDDELAFVPDEKPEDSGQAEIGVPEGAKAENTLEIPCEQKDEPTLLRKESEPVATTPATTEPAKPVEATEPTETPEPEWDVAAERKKDESAFFRELEKLSVEVAAKEAELDELKEQLKVAKAEHNLAVAKFLAFGKAGVKYRTKPTKPAKPTQKPADTKVEPAKTEPANAESTDAPKPATDAPKEEMGKESWRATKTESILEGIERLGKTKRAKLLEHFPTFGHLMDARIEASKEFVPFAKKLPDGIGEGIATELINRMDAAIVPGM